MSIRLMLKIGVSPVVSMKTRKIIANGKFISRKLKTGATALNTRGMAESLKEELDHMTVDDWERILEPLVGDIDRLYEAHARSCLGKD